MFPKRLLEVAAEFETLQKCKRAPRAEQPPLGGSRELMVALDLVRKQRAQPDAAAVGRSPLGGGGVRSESGCESWVGRYVIVVL